MTETKSTGNEKLLRGTFILTIASFVVKTAGSISAYKIFAIETKSTGNEKLLRGTFILTIASFVVKTAGSISAYKIFATRR